MTPDTIANVLLQIVLIAVLNVTVYFTYTTYIEQDIVVTESQRIIDDLTTDLRIALPQDSISNIKNEILPYLVAPDLSADDKKVKDQNSRLVLATIKLFIIGLLSCLIIVVGMAIYFNFDLKKLFIHNIGVLVAVAIVEIIFLTFIVKNYISIDSNFVKFRMIQTLQDYVKREQLF